MAVLMIGADEEQRIAGLVSLAQANPLTREYLARMSAGFDPLNPSTRHQACEAIPLNFTIDLPVGIRVTYTEEEQPVGRCRHLSASIDKVGAMLAPDMFDELLDLFGFVGRVALLTVTTWREVYQSGRLAVNVLEPIGDAA